MRKLDEVENFYFVLNGIPVLAASHTVDRTSQFFITYKCLSSMSLIVALIPRLSSQCIYRANNLRNTPIIGTPTPSVVHKKRNYTFLTSMIPAQHVTIISIEDYSLRIKNIRGLRHLVYESRCLCRLFCPLQHSIFPRPSSKTTPHLHLKKI